MISMSICVFAVFAIIIPAFFAIMQAYVYIHSCNLTYMYMQIDSSAEAISTDRSKFPYLALSICQSATHICGERTMVAYSKDVYEALVAAAL